MPELRGHFWRGFAAFQAADLLQPKMPKAISPKELDRRKAVPFLRQAF
jgi:hypothetical protein